MTRPRVPHTNSARFRRQRPSAPLTALSALLALLAWPASSPGDQGDPTPPPPKNGSGAAERHRWALDQDHRYVWTFDEQPVGETIFRISRREKSAASSTGETSDPGTDSDASVPAGANSASDTDGSTDEGFQVKMRFEYERENQHIEVEREYTLSSTWGLVSFASKTSLETINNIHSTVSARGWVEEDTLAMDIQSAQPTDETVRSTLKIPRGAIVLFPQGVEIWALHAPRILPREDAMRLDIAYPFFERIYRVDLRPIGSLDVAVGGKVLPCTGYRFISEEKQLQGELWVDAGGRLVRYRQGKLLIRLDPAAADARRKRSG